MKKLTSPTPAKPAHACEFDELRSRMRRCARKPRRRPSRMVGIEVAYVALADWIALVAESERHAA
ncbi:hypothetical protein FN976_25645 [Caenimonas sedimenti]|uniref:Uncharacterized protein n=1 Tax=Caenimonas sedimenti TaxID=2596921 RepID=A0A562ZGR8_9BURK|nr:hypothetical protein [Caenimonas sedimenti]TWO67772.1 hypothetical protein FN976_25645 [Caenimonas sedimenti]